MSFVKFIFVLLIVVPVVLVMFFIFRILTSEYNEAIKNDRKQDGRADDRQNNTDSRTFKERKNKRVKGQKYRRNIGRNNNKEKNTGGNYNSKKKTSFKSEENNYEDIPAYRRNNPSYDAYRRRMDENANKSTFDRASLINRNRENK